MSKFLYWVLRIISALLLLGPLVLCLPGLLFHVLSEEVIEKNNKEPKKIKIDGE